jgi:hypothetical protein
MPLLFLQDDMMAHLEGLGRKTSLRQLLGMCSSLVQLLQVDARLSALLSNVAAHCSGTTKLIQPNRQVRFRATMARSAGWCMWCTGCTIPHPAM